MKLRHPPKANNLVETVLRFLCEKAAKYLPRRSIAKITGEPYLDRYYLFGEKPFGFPAALKPVLDFLPFGVYLHHIHSSDTGPGLHNHPWDMSLSCILAGEYLEERLYKIFPTRYHPGMINLIRRLDFHRIIIDRRDAWTLFICGRRVGGWGFVNPQTMIYTPGKLYAGRLTRKE